MHFIPVAMDLSDLVEKARWARRNPKKAKAIGLRAQEWAQQNFNEHRLVERAATAASAVLEARQGTLECLKNVGEEKRKVS